MSTTHITPEVRNAVAKIQRHAAMIGTDPALILDIALIDDMAVVARSRATGWRGWVARASAFLNRPNIRAAWGTLLIFVSCVAVTALTDSGVIA